MRRPSSRALFRAGLAIDVLLAMAAVFLLVSTAPLVEGPLPSFFFDRPFAALLVLIVAATAWLIDRRHPGHRVAAILAWLGFLAGLEAAALLYSYRGLGLAGHSLPGANLAGLLQPMIIAPAFAVAFVFLPLTFPDGRLPAPRWRPLVWLTVAVGMAMELGLLLIDATDDSIWEASAWTKDPWVASGPLVRLGQVLYVSAFVALAAAMAAAGLSLVIRYKHSNRDTRQQIKWFVYLALPAVLVNGLIAAHAPLGVLGPVSGLVAVAGIGVAVLRHRLYDIDVVISKTIVYGSLAVLIGALYVAVVAGVGGIVNAQGPNLALTLSATVVVAIAFDPARRRMEKLANRIVFGPRATPYEALTELSRRLNEALTPGETLPRVAETVAGAVGAVAGRATLRLPDGTTQTATWPPGRHDGSREESVPVVRLGETVGELAVVAPPGEPLRPADRALLSRLSDQCGVALANLRLTAELEARFDELSRQAQELDASRRRLVTARDSERRRLSEEIDRRIGPSLDAVETGLQSLLGSSTWDPGKVEAGLEKLRSITTATLEELRAIARGLYPPLLADKGLVAALEAEARKLTVPVTIGSRMGGIVKGPIAATAYFCCRDVLVAAEHDGAARVDLELASSDGRLTVSLCQVDSRPGFADHSLQLAADRAAAAGGSLTMQDLDGQRTGISITLPLTGQAAEPVAALQASASESGEKSALGM